MASIEVSGVAITCCKCGMGYGRKKGNFLVSYSQLNRGTGYMPYCSECVDKMYNAYMAEGAEPQDAVRQMCRKLDLYWNLGLFSIVEKTNTTRSMMTSYITKINGLKYAGKCYDDTLREEGVLWHFDKGAAADALALLQEQVRIQNEERNGGIEGVDPKLTSFWGMGFKPEFYKDLEYKYANWTDGLGQLEPGERAIYKQICILEATISRDTAEGKPIDKHVNALNSLLGSANLKPTQRKAEGQDADLENMPFGVGIRKWENTRPVPDVDPEMKDVDGIVKYVTVWFLGHLCKMVGIKNSYCKLYEEEIEKLRVKNPEFEDDDDETLFNNIFTGDVK